MILSLIISGEVLATTINWETISPKTGGVTVSTAENTVELGKSSSNFGMQDIGIYGAGFYTANGGDLFAILSLFTWDCWNFKNGYHDRFLITTSSDGFFWEKSYLQKTISAFGGESFRDGKIESYKDQFLITLEPDTYFSFILETKLDFINPSFGNGKFIFMPNNNASPVPEPTTMLLFGTGIVCLVGLGRKK